MTDDELIQIARESIGERFCLSPAQAARLRGTTRKELEDDARLMRRELQLPHDDDLDGAEKPRDDGGRYAKGDGGVDMNAAIREAAGR